MELQIALNKNERWELRQQEKLERKEKQIAGIRNRKIKTVVLWTIGFAAIAGMIYGLIRSANQSEQNRPGQAYAIQGQEHIAIGANHPEYNSNPPTSGWHYEQEATWGVSQVELPDEQLIHNLEHGGIWISYTGIDDATKSALEKIAQSQSKVVVEPRVKDDAPIVVASWGRAQKFQALDEQGILNFIKANSNRSPEPFAQ